MNFEKVKESLSRRNVEKIIQKNNDVRRVPSIIVILAVLLIFTILTSLVVGRYSISIKKIFELIIANFNGNQWSIAEILKTVLFKVRMPRILAAMLVGAALSVSGATYQGMFRNPMVSPDILGASAGAGFGAALGILMSLGIAGIQFMAFLFGIVAVALSYFISKAISGENSAVLVLVLTGMVVSTLFQSFISITKYVADPYSKLPAITFWLMGGLGSINMKDVKMLSIPIILGAVPLMLIRWKLNVLSFGEEEAKALGIDTGKLRVLIILCSTLMTSAAVSLSGMIGWVGLIIPHFTRMLVGPNYKVLLPASLIVGSTYLLFVDDIARSVFPVEIPLGILTALIGAPFFIYLMLNGRKGWM